MAPKLQNTNICLNKVDENWRGRSPLFYLVNGTKAQEKKKGKAITTEEKTNKQLKVSNCVHSFSVNTSVPLQKLIQSRYYNRYLLLSEYLEFLILSTHNQNHKRHK